MPSPTVTSIIALVLLGVCIYGIVAPWKSYNKAKKSVDAQRDQKVLPVILEDSVNAMNNKRKVAIGATIGSSLGIVGVLIWWRQSVRQSYLSG